jgi:fibro-slime domain-containing protein
MKVRNTSLIVVASMFLMALASVVLWPHKVRLTRAEGPPAEIVLAGIVRDFVSAHPDFDATPADGFGHVADLVVPWVDAGAQPALAAPGYVVQQQWRDRHGRPIAPHLAGLTDPFGDGDAGAETLGGRVDRKIDLKKEATVDAFSSLRGPYGESRNYGRGAYLSTNSTKKDHVDLDHKSLVHGSVMVGPGGDPDRVIKGKGMVGGAIGALTAAEPMPLLAVPDDRQEYVDHLDLEGPVTLTGDIDLEDDRDVPAMYVGELHIKKDASVLVDGDLRIYCDRKLKVDGGRITLLPDSALTIYVEGNAEFKHQTLVNTIEPDTAACVINVLGRHKVEVKDKSHVYATVIAPDSKVEIEDDSHLYGGFVGREMKIEDRAGFHVDSANATAAPRNFVVTVREKIEIKDKSEVDGFDSTLGPYGDGNKGIDALLITNTVEKDKVKIEDRTTVTGDVLVGYGGHPERVIKLDKNSTVTGAMGRLGDTMPIPFVVPPVMGEREGEVKFKNGSYTLSRNVYCKKFKVEKKANLEIVGDVTIRCDEYFEVHDKSHVTLAPNARLTVYYRKELKVEDRSSLNMGGNPQHVSIRRMTLGKGKVKVKKESQLVAWVQGAQTEMEVEDGAEFFGSFTGKKIKVKKSKLHVDMAYVNPCLDVADSLGEAGDESRGGIATADSFGQWFRSVSGINRAAVHRITLTRRDDGVYEYVDDAFHPIDGRLLGDEGAPHNHFLTYVLKADFAYTTCAGGWLEVGGGDGAWVFVNGRLAIDLGGMRPGTTQFIEVDRLGLRDGRHRIELFYAQRHRGTSDLIVRTNLQLDTSRVIPDGSYD